MTLQKAFVTTAEKTWKKVEGSDGNTYHFADGTPKTEQAFNSATQHIKHKGQPAKVAIPDENVSTGYRRVEVDPKEASSLGQELRLFRQDVPGEPQETVILDGESYDTDRVAGLNQRITDRFGPDAVMKY